MSNCYFFCSVFFSQLTEKAVSVISTRFLRSGPCFLCYPWDIGICQFKGQTFVRTKCLDKVRIPFCFLSTDTVGSTLFVGAEYTTEEALKKYEEQIEKIHTSLHVDLQIADILIEEAPAFFNGQKSAEEVARLVQSKANIYVNEQR